jgi:hypothetical protein
MRRNNGETVNDSIPERRSAGVPDKDYIPCAATSCGLERGLQLLVGGMRHMTIS